jgi:hypothetical protein
MSVSSTDKISVISLSIIMNISFAFYFGVIIFQNFFVDHILLSFPNGTIAGIMISLILGFVLTALTFVLSSDVFSTKSNVE